MLPVSDDDQHELEASLTSLHLVGSSDGITGPVFIGWDWLGYCLRGAVPGEVCWRVGKRVGTVRAEYVGGSGAACLRTESAFLTVGGRSDCSDEELVCRKKLAIEG